jgi:hypothetical protein
MNKNAGNVIRLNIPKTNKNASMPDARGDVLSCDDNQPLTWVGLDRYADASIAW